MCVIMKYTLDSGFPKEETLKSAEMLNKDGGGIAWIDNGKVKWEKGMHITSGYIMDLIEKEKMQLPIIVHFRIATHGTVDTPLCHPFAISEGVDDLSAKGEDEQGVLFHNGVWHDYDEMAMKVATSDKDIQIPDGDLSDSRIMAWLVKYLGMNYLSMIKEKSIVLTPKGIFQYGDGWCDVKVDDKTLECSNDNFEPKTYSHWGGYGYNDESRFGDWYGRGRITTSDKDNFTKKSKKQRKKDKKKQKAINLSKVEAELEDQTKDMQNIIDHETTTITVDTSIEQAKERTEYLYSQEFRAKVTMITEALEIQKHLWDNLVVERFGDIYNDEGRFKEYRKWISWASEFETADEMLIGFDTEGGDWERGLIPMAKAQEIEMLDRFMEYGN